MRHCSGLAILDPGESNRTYSEADLRLKAFSGATLRFQRGWLYDAKGLFSPGFIDQQLKIHEKVGKWISLLPMSGDSQQPWGQANLDKYYRLIEDCAKRYNGHDLVRGWHITGCTPPGTSEELHWDNGKFSDQIVTACEFLTFHAGEHFVNCDLLQAISGKDRQGQIDKVVKYGAQLFPGRYLIKNNNAKAVQIDAFHNKRVIAFAKKYKTRYGSEPAGSYFYESGRMGVGDVNAMINQSREMARRAGTDPDEAYIAVYWPDRKNVNLSKIK
jgi:hypothetical protein